MKPPVCNLLLLGLIFHSTIGLLQTKSKEPIIKDFGKMFAIESADFKVSADAQIIFCWQSSKARGFPKNELVGRRTITALCHDCIDQLQDE